MDKSMALESRDSGIIIIAGVGSILSMRLTVVFRGNL